MSYADKVERNRNESGTEHQGAIRRRRDGEGQNVLSYADKVRTKIVFNQELARKVLGVEVELVDKN